MNIIQHHEPIDFEALFRQMESATIGIDGRDLELFAKNFDEIHSFLGSAARENRIKIALDYIVASDEAVEIINKCRRFMLIIRHNPECERPLMMDEISAINDFVLGLHEDTDIQWSLMQDSSLGNRVYLILLCNLK